MSRKLNRYVVMSLLLFGFAGVFASTAMAFPVPAAGSAFYDVYDVIVNMMLRGAPGIAAGVVMMVIAAVMFSNNQILKGVLSAMSCVLLLKADTIVTSFGAVF